ncbi:hypothetical protein CUJ83_05125 [Methanocella sp. CWC-04]|uniref:Yip1 domain-containing protein n=1 Tax=Methanooceanicella nereidis TaxID=2052831 RepID=A0AAP2RD02_9EURY|nr:Yip1 family protein [Methanocella sp. CWC-04]MCD1294380.1 hypothetical protein [Methanocella sp. CWC-04]
MNFNERIIGMFTKPDETIKDIIKEPRIEEALVVVGVYAIFAMIVAYISASHINYIYDMPGMSDMGALRTITTITSLVFGFLTPIIGWPIVTGILHLFSMVFGGDGKFYPNMLTAIGYTDVVKIIFVIVSIILLTQTPYVTLEISQSNPTGTISALNELYGNVFYIASTIVGLLGLLWSCWLGVLAIKNGEKLSMTQALIVVGVPLVLYLAFTYGGMLLTAL